MSERTDADLIREALRVTLASDRALGVGDGRMLVVLAALDRLVAERESCAAELDFWRERMALLDENALIWQKMVREAEAERDRLAEARRQALAFITDAVEALGEDEAWLLANDPDNTWCRILAARDALAGTPL